MINNNIPTPCDGEVIMYQGKMIEVVSQRMLIGEKEVTFEWARRSPGTRLLITTNHGTILLTREYRTELKSWDYRLPGGKVFDSLADYNQYLQEDSEDILKRAEQAAKKEAYEEAGITINTTNLYYISRCGATIEWDLYYFTAHLQSEDVEEQRLEAGENIEVVWSPYKEAMDIALNGAMKEDRSVAVVLRFLNAQSTEQN